MFSVKFIPSMMAVNRELEQMPEEFTLTAFCHAIRVTG
jgi:hypothetical protein